MKDLLEKPDTVKSPQIGKLIEGKVVGKGRASLFLDLGSLGAGIIYGREFIAAKNEIKKLKDGDNIFAKVVDLENDEGYWEMSLNQASNEMVWTELQQKKNDSETIKITITGANKGGLLTAVSGVQAFLPVSQLMPEHYPRVEGADSAKILKELQKFIGQELEVKIFDLNSKENKLILSEKAKESAKLKELLKNYRVGDTVEGEITGVTDFGVFIKFPLSGESLAKEGALEGLIHISELDWQLIDDPADIVKVGDKVKAKIIAINDDKVSLSLKALKKDPWQEAENQYKKGDKIEGEVVKFNPFGAFIKITPQIQGLCHISEFGTKTKMEETLKLDQKYQFEILTVEPLEHRMSLKLKEEK